MKFYSSDGSSEIKRNYNSGEVEVLIYLGGDPNDANAVLKSDSNSEEILYLHKDYLGSIVAITDANGEVIEKRHFDAWGNLSYYWNASGQTTLPDGINTFLLLDRGYTSHEHLLSVGLIHMNGRLYEPVLHRFLQPDNFIQDPYNTTSYNRYAYAWNNPLKYTDPSGEIVWFIAAAVAYGVGVGISGEWNPFKWNLNTFATAIFAGAMVFTGAKLFAALKQTGLKTFIKTMFKENLKQNLISGSLNLVYNQKDGFKLSDSGYFLAGFVGANFGGAIVKKSKVLYTMLGSGLLTSANSIIFGDTKNNNSIGYQLLQKFVGGALSGLSGASIGNKSFYPKLAKNKHFSKMLMYAGQSVASDFAYTDYKKFKKLNFSNFLSSIGSGFINGFFQGDFKEGKVFSNILNSFTGYSLTYLISYHSIHGYEPISYKGFQQKFNLFSIKSFFNGSYGIDFF